MIVVLITYTPAHIQYTVYNTLKLQFNILMWIAQCPYYTSIYYSDYIINCMAARIYLNNIILHKLNKLY